MNVYLRLYPKPFVFLPEGMANYQAFRLDPSADFDEVLAMLDEAGEDDENRLRVVLPDLAFPVPFRFRKRDWSAWVLHHLPGDEFDSGSAKLDD